MDLPDGSNDLLLTLGDVDNVAQTAEVFVRGTDVGTVGAPGAEFVLPAYAATVTDGDLTLPLIGTTADGGDGLAYIEGLEIIPQGGAGGSGMSRPAVMATDTASSSIVPATGGSDLPAGPLSLVRDRTGPPSGVRFAGLASTTSPRRPVITSSLRAPDDGSDGVGAIALGSSIAPLTDTISIVVPQQEPRSLASRAYGNRKHPRWSPWDWLDGV